MSDIDKYRYDLEIIRLTAEQVIKDFGMHGFEITFSGNEFTAWDEMLHQVEPILAGLYKNNKSAFQALLYRVDLSEKDLRQLMKERDFSASVAEAVIRREFKKVLIRKYYS